MHNLNHRRTWKEHGKRISPYASWTGRWNNGQGKYWKRQLSKSRRQAWKAPRRYKANVYEGICSWKNW